MTVGEFLVQRNQKRAELDTLGAALDAKINELPEFTEYMKKKKEFADWTFSHTGVLESAPITLESIVGLVSKIKEMA